MRTRKLGRTLSLSLAALLALGAAWACGGDDTEDTDGTAGQAGSSGSSGSGGGGGEPSTGGEPSGGEPTAGGEPSGGEPSSAGTSGAAGSGGSSAGGGGAPSSGGSAGATPEAGAPAGGVAGQAGAAGGGGAPSGPPPLEEDDFPDVSPCPNQDLLTDAAAFSDLQEALTDGMIVYLDVPYDAQDPEIFDKKCGRPGAFDPAIYVDEISPFMAGDPDLSDIVMFQNGGICADGFDNTSFGTGDGFPTAGEYRKEFRAAYMDSSYELRARIEASGSAAGDTFADQGIGPNGTEDLVYEVDGVEVNESELWDELINAMSASGDSLPTVELGVRLDADSDVVFTSVIELICAEEIQL